MDDMVDVVGTAGSFFYVYKHLTRFGADFPRFHVRAPLGLYFEDLRAKLILLGEDARERLAAAEPHARDLALDAAARLSRRDGAGAEALRASLDGSPRLAEIVAAAAGRVVVEQIRLEDLCALSATVDDEVPALRARAQALAATFHYGHLPGLLAMAVEQLSLGQADYHATSWLLTEVARRVPRYVSTRDRPQPPEPLADLIAASNDMSSASVVGPRSESLRRTSSSSLELGSAPTAMV